MLYKIVVFPNPTIQDFANSYRKRYDAHYNLIQPHLTIRKAEQWGEEQLHQAVDLLNAKVTNFAPFEINFNRFSSFYPVSDVVYMALADPQSFIDCYEHICSGPLVEKDRRFTFTPHLSIGRNLGNDQLHDVLSSLRRIPLDYASSIDRVHLMYQTDNQAWTAYQSFLFQK